MKLFFDTEWNEVITEKELLEEYKELKETGNTEAETFEIYISNCTDKNGTLEII